jgi:hypothetical protein
MDDILVTAPLLDNGSSPERSRDEHQSRILNIGRTKISGLFFLRKFDKQIGMNWDQRRRGREDVSTILVPYFNCYHKASIYLYLWFSFSRMGGRQVLLARPRRKNMVLKHQVFNKKKPRHYHPPNLIPSIYKKKNTF